MTEAFYRRRLPHWVPDRAVFFLTWRLEGSLPKQVVERLRQEKRRMEEEPGRPGESAEQRALRTGKRIFARWDKALADALHTRENAPRWLGLDKVARIFVETVREKQDDLFRLHRYVIMPNHVHLLLEPAADPISGLPVALQRITQNLKGASSRRANFVLGRTGPFWQAEGFDHWVRDSQEHERIVAYIDDNPVRAGLCGKPESWPWGSLGEEANR